jgi:hypothetical protein
LAEIKIEKIPTAEVWAEFKLRTDLLDPPVIKLRLKPAFRSSILREIFYFYAKRPEKQKKQDIKESEMFERLVDAAIAVILKNVVDWDLMKNGEPIPCDEENKRYFLEPLLWDLAEEKVEAKGEGLEPEVESQQPEVELNFFWVRLAGFMIDVKNFSKN